jgi:peptide/nickel transport system permease protein
VVSGYILRRLVHMVPVLLLISAIVFFVFHIVPGDMAVARLGQGADPQQVAITRHAMGLDRPLWVQYLDWLGAALRGDLGTSYLNNQPVTSLILQTLPATLELAVLGMILALLISVPLGILAAYRSRTWIDHLARMLALAGFCIPRYWLAVLLILAFALNVQWFPVSGYVDPTQDPIGNLQHAALPVVTLAITIAAIQMRFLRSSLLDVIGQDYVRTARAKGLGAEAVLVRHALKNALIPFVTVIGLELGGLLGGLVVVEQIFAWPGVGWLMIESIDARDYATVQGVVLVIAAGVVLINLAVDVLYARLDPRIRYV